MSIDLLREVNELIIESIFEMSDQEAASCIGDEGFPNKTLVAETQVDLIAGIRESRAKRLQATKEGFQQSKNEISERLAELSSGKGIAQMLADIAKALGNGEKVPEGLLVAFREQTQNSEASENDIKELWESFYRLGLIDEDEDPTQ